MSQKRQLTPTSSEPVSVLNQKTSTFWGTVTDTNNQPLSNIVVSIGGQGVKTDATGQYSLIINQSGMLPITFDNPATKEKYQLAQTYEQSIFVEKGQTIHKNFILEKVKTER